MVTDQPSTLARERHPVSISDPATDAGTLPIGLAQLRDRQGMYHAETTGSRFREPLNSEAGQATNPARSWQRPPGGEALIHPSRLSAGRPNHLPRLEPLWPILAGVPAAAALEGCAKEIPRPPFGRQAEDLNRIDKVA